MSHAVTVDDDVVGTLTITVVVTILSQPLDAVSVSVNVPDVVYVLDPTLTLCPVQIVCVLDDVRSTDSPTVTVAEAVQPQVSVTVTLYEPALNPVGSADVEPVLQR